MNSKALELKAKGVDVFAFGVGEPDFEPPEHVREAAKRAIDAGCSKYTAVTGIPALKEAICDATERSRGWRPKTGERLRQRRREAHALQPRARALRAGRRGRHPQAVLGELSGAGAPRRRDARCSSTRAKRTGGSSRPPQLEKALGPRTKAVILCTPSQPHGPRLHGRRDARARRGRAKERLLAHRRRDLRRARVRGAALRLRREDRARSARAHGRRRRRVEDVRDDRLAYRLGARARAAHQGARRGAGPEHDEPDGGRAARGDRGAQGTDRGLRRASARCSRSAATRWSPGSRRSRASSAASRTARSTRSPTCAASTASTGTARRSRPTKTSPSGCSRRRAVAAVPGSGFGAPGYVRFSYAASEERIAAGCAAIRAAAAAAR